MGEQPSPFRLCAGAAPTRGEADATEAISGSGHIPTLPLQRFRASSIVFLAGNTEVEEVLKRVHVEDSGSQEGIQCSCDHDAPTRALML